LDLSSHHDNNVMAYRSNVKLWALFPKASKQQLLYTGVPRRHSGKTRIRCGKLSHTLREETQRRPQIV